jgi:hypothetical protein
VLFSSRTLILLFQKIVIISCVISLSCVRDLFVSVVMVLHFNFMYMCFHVVLATLIYSSFQKISRSIRTLDRHLRLSHFRFGTYASIYFMCLTDIHIQVTHVILCAFFTLFHSNLLIFNGVTRIILNFIPWSKTSLN